MNISGISTSLGAQAFESTARRLGESARVAQDKTTHEAPATQARGIRGRRGLALGMLQQELRMTIKAQFRARFAVTTPAYSETRQAPTVDEIARETLGAAKQVVAEAPTTAASSLISFRAKVQEAVSYVLGSLVSDEHDTDDVDAIAKQVGDGLDKLEGEVANNRESTASVLALDTRSKQRSTIQIRTQEGDVVRFSLKRIDTMTASDVAFSDGDTSVTSTEVAVSSRSRMVMKVEGDLNESELAAIRNVFDQAETIANEFFGGDIGAAFNMAQGFEFDTEQLARVKMRFRMHEVSNVAYAETVRAIPKAPVEAPVEAPVITPARIDAPGGVVAAPEANAEPAVTSAAPDALEAVPQPDEGSPVVATSALEDFFDALSAFLRSVGEGFAGSSSESNFRYHYSESFKLEVLKAVLHTVAPGDAMHAADNAATVIDSIGESSENHD